MIAIIPCRAGSERIKNKNTADCAGKPLLLWTIETAKKSKLTDIYVVSDSPTALDIGRKAGVKAIELPPEYAKSDTPVLKALKYALDALKTKGNDVQKFMVLQCTSPLRLQKDIDNCIELSEKSGSNFPLVSMTKLEHYPIYTVVFDTYASQFIPENEIKHMHSQDYPDLYYINGAIYIFTRENIETGKVITDNTLCYEMPKERSYDINTEHDLRVASMLLRSNENLP